MRTISLFLPRYSPNKALLYRARECGFAVSDEQKFRWEAMSDRRGELGIRVKQGAEYELTIEARGFKPQTRKIDAREGNREDLTLQMEQLAGGKP